MITIRDVATEAGTSAATVSAVLNGGRGNTRVGAPTAAHVNKIARQLGYRTNTMARIARRGRSDTIALILAMDDPCVSTLPPQVLKATEAALGAQDQHLLVAGFTDERLVSREGVPRLIAEHICDGLIIDYTHKSPPQLNELLESYRIPAIWLNRKLAGNCVHPDDFAAGRDAARHLLELGHRRIAFVNYGFEEDFNEEIRCHYSETDRFEGYASAMKDHGATARHIRRPHRTTEADLPALAHALLTEPERPTAIVSYSPWHATSLAYSAALLGLRVPRDLSLVTFGYEPVTSLGFEMTRLELPAPAIAEAAVDQILKLVDAPRPQPPSSIHCAFIEGASCATPPVNHQ